MAKPIMECVPNVSEGRKPEVIEALAQSIRRVKDVKLLHQDAGYAANRTVFTFAGPPEAVAEAAFNLCAAAVELIDMREHAGTHPRMGAVDVCPFVPIQDCTLEDCVATARTIGKRVYEELGAPVYFYESAASRPERKNLATVRKGEYEGLKDKMQDPDWLPDCGTPNWNPRTGTFIIGARPFLIAWNINLVTKDTAIAKQIAARLRGSGRMVVTESGERQRIPGRFSGLKAIGWYIEEYECCQVSTNVVDPDHVNLLDVYAHCAELARAFGTEVSGSELIGLIPARYLRAAAYPGLTGTEAYASAVERLGLNDLAEFNWRERVLEMLLKSGR